MNTRAAEGFGEFARSKDGPEFIPRENRFSVEAIARSVRNFATLAERASEIFWLIFTSPVESVCPATTSLELGNCSTDSAIFFNSAKLTVSISLLPDGK